MSSENATSGAPILELRDISKAFGAVQALSGVSFDVCAGEVHALLGENGAGKSTLIKVITGAHRPDAGRIILHGTSLEELSPSRAHRLGIACIYQQPALFPDLTVAENIALRVTQPRAFSRVNRKAHTDRANELLSRVGAQISPYAEVRALSMPEQQLVEIACAVGGGARVLIMDEPTASLTRSEQERLFAVVKDLRKAGMAIIYISHRLEEISVLADRVTVLRDGKSIGTQRASELSEAEMIRLMVGREVTQLYPPAQGSPGEIELEVRGLGSSRAGVHGIDLSIRAGEILGLAGLVGAGRTELARVLFGIEPADEGQILCRGEVVRIRNPREAMRHGIAYVPEDRRRHGAILPMNVGENITMASHRRLFPNGVLHLEREAKLAAEFICSLGIKCDGHDAAAGSLSGGNQQKVAVARWLATKPRVLILDEPTQGVDVGAKSEIHRIIRELTKGGLAVLMISSDLPEVLGMSDRIAVMRGGGVVQVFQREEADAARVMRAALGYPQEVRG